MLSYRHGLGEFDVRAKAEGIDDDAVFQLDEESASRSVELCLGGQREHCLTNYCLLTDSPHDGVLMAAMMTTRLTVECSS